MTDKTLYWAETGEVTCKAHAPFKGSDTWKWGRWSKMTAAESSGMGRSDRTAS